MENKNLDEKRMNINMTKEEYRVLLDMICISDWILDAFSKDGRRFPDHHALKIKLFSLFKEMEAEAQIEYDAEMNDFFETEGYTAEIQAQFIEPFEQAIFWDELTHRLAKRDLLNEVGLEAYRKMDAMERYKRLSALEDQYEKEFQQNGLDKLVIK